MQNCLTVDVEEWFHICGVGAALEPARWPKLPSRVIQNTRELLELFERAHARATFFVLGWIAERYPELVREIVSAGHEIGSHGYWHRRVYDLTPEEFSEELDASRSALTAAGAKFVAGFRAPEWSINDRSRWAIEILARKGFTFDSSMTPLRIIGNPRYPKTPYMHATPSGPLAEFPPLVARRFGQNVPLGGGWGLRMANPPDVLRTIGDHNRAGRSVVLFVHPWEIDADPPRVRLPAAQRFAHYFRLNGFKQRFEQIVSGAAFGPMGELPPPAVRP